jgi:hypothetical protein
MCGVYNIYREAGPNGENMDFNYVVTRCRNLNLQALPEYLYAYTIFTLRGDPTIYDHKAVMRRMREIASDPENYLRIDFNYRYSTTTNLYNSYKSTQKSQSVPHDSDIAIGIFFHMCESALNTTTVKYSNIKFMTDRYVIFVCLVYFRLCLCLLCCMLL